MFIKLALKGSRHAQGEITAGIICNQIFSDHPDLRETALFGLSAVRCMLTVFLKTQFSPLPRLRRHPTFMIERFLSKNQRTLKFESD